MRSKYDLHVHTDVSDGEYPPGEVLEKARERGLEVIAITDHGKLEGAREIMKNPPKDIEVIPGVEFTADIANEFFHILGYFNEVPDLSFDFHEEMDFEREKHFFWEIANKLGRGAHVWKEEMIQARRIIERINKENGLAVLAHPCKLNLSKNGLENLVKSLKSYGLRGIEILNGKHADGDTEFYAGLANKYDLLKVSGTDYHGYFNPIGTNVMTEEYMNAFLKELRHKE